MIDYKAWFHKQLFQPTLVGIFINPLFFIRYELAKGIRVFAPLITGDVLDFGCGTKPYQNLFPAAKSYTGLDLEGTQHASMLMPEVKADIYYDGGDIPCADATFDSVVCFEMIDDVMNPSHILGEIYRVLKPGGCLLISSSFVWQEHELPNDFLRYTSLGFVEILNEAGFNLIEYQKSGNFLTTIFQMISAFIYEKSGNKNLIKFATIQTLFVFPIAAMGLLLSKILPSSQTLYLGNLALVIKPI